MPKANKHAEVKPSKFKTSLCEYYIHQKECPFGSHCAFAHGEHELQTEECNVEILRATGMQRLDGNLICARPPCNATMAESSLGALFPPTGSTRRRPVFVSLPYWSESRIAGIAQDDDFDTMVGEEDGCAASAERVPKAASTHRSRCSSRFSATCSAEAPLMYRHNPYGLSANLD